MTNNTQFAVTRKFTAGPLAGLTHTGTTNVPMPVGLVVAKPIGGSPYVVVACEAL